MSLRKYILIFLFTFFCVQLAAQDSTSVAPAQDSLANQKDFMDVLRKLFHKPPPAPKKENKTLAVLPAIGLNPSVGFLLGINFVKSFYRGDPATTKLSISQFDVSYTTKKLFISRLRHNIFTENDKWNLQGNWQYMRNFVYDYGIGEEAAQDPPVQYPIRFNYFRLQEKVYRKIGKSWFAGFGASFDIRSKISDEKLDSQNTTPHYRYSIDHNFDPKKYNANGLILNVQYNTREHPNRSFGGMYVDLNLRYNTKLLGSTKESGQLYAELRKYFSLSKKNPEHVLAFWTWGSFLMWGDLPYLELAGTAYDTYNRSGRAYTLGRFKGPRFAYFESEYRFPISTESKFLSGVVFGNFQTASDGKGMKMFDRVDPGYGIGLRMLFNKHSRTNICLDYARGRYGSSGFFFSLNEAF